MAYIRCLNNPEGLYVWDDTNGKTYFSIHGSENDPMIGVPSEEVEAFFRGLYKWERSHYVEAVPFSHGCMSVVECSIPVLNSDWTSEDIAAFGEETECRIKLTLGGQELFMWEVTWIYLRDRFYSQVIGPSECRSVKTFGSWPRRLYCRLFGE